jgi:hypothetical protein
MHPDGQKPDIRQEYRTSRPMTAKSISTKGTNCRFGRSASKAGNLTPGDLSCCPLMWTGGTARDPERRTEVSRGHSRSKSEGLNEEEK